MNALHFGDRNFNEFVYTDRIDTIYYEDIRHPTYNKDPTIQANVNPHLFHETADIEIDVLMLALVEALPEWFESFHDAAAVFLKFQVSHRVDLQDLGVCSR